MNDTKYNDSTVKNIFVLAKDAGFLFSRKKTIKCSGTTKMEKSQKVIECDCYSQEIQKVQKEKRNRKANVNFLGTTISCSSCKLIIIPKNVTKSFFICLTLMLFPNHLCNLLPLFIKMTASNIPDPLSTLIVHFFLLRMHCSSILLLRKGSNGK